MQQDMAGVADGEQFWGLIIFRIDGLALKEGGKKSLKDTNGENIIELFKTDFM